jgi:hypothetical protein
LSAKNGFVVLAAVAAATACGCGDALVDGDYLGDATLRLNGLLATPVGQPQAAAIGAVWIGYSGLVTPSVPVETSVLPITEIRFPPNFVCEVLDRPPSAGRYAWRETFIPAFMRVAELVMIDDVDQNGRFALDAGGIQPPDLLLARAERHQLLFVQQPPPDPAALSRESVFVTNWEELSPGYNLVEGGPLATPADDAGRVVPSDSVVIFTVPEAP